MPAYTDFEYLLSPTVEQLSQAVTDFEAYLWEEFGPSRLPAPSGLIMFVILDPHHPKPFLPVLLPYTQEELIRVSGRAQPRGRMGLFLAGLGHNFCTLGADKIRASTAGFHREGQRLLWTAWYADVCTTEADVPHYATDYELDIPDEHRQDRRNLVCADGRGNLVVVSRPATGDGPVQTDTYPCIPDVERPTRYLHTDTQDAPQIAGAAPWGLAALAIGYRYVFEGQALPDAPG